MSIDLLKNNYLFNQNEVRIATDEIGEVLFCVKDVCKALEIQWRGQVKTLPNTPKKWTSIVNIATEHGNRDMIFVSEGGLYALIFRSNKPNAIAFRNWVLDEVLPQIRKTGGYVQALKPSERLGRINSQGRVVMARKIINTNEFMTTYFTVAEEKRFFNAIKYTAGMLAKRDFAIFNLLRSSGIRVGTLVGLRLDEVVNGLSSIKGYLPLRKEICKGGYAYDVFISERVRESLEELVRLHKKYNAGHEMLVLGKNGNALSIRNIQHRNKFWVNEAKITPEASPHWWRHTKAMRIMADSSASDPRAIVKRVLGHRSLSSTEIYTKPTKEDFEASAGA